MSRTATATPPAPYFPQRVSTPTMRHTSAPNVASSHFSKSHQHQHHHQAKRRAKHVASPKEKENGRARSPKYASSDALGLSFEEVPRPQSNKSREDADGDDTMEAQEEDRQVLLSRPESRAESVASQATFSSYSTARTDDTEESMSLAMSTRLTPTPPFSFAGSSGSASVAHTPLATPSSSVGSLPCSASDAYIQGGASAGSFDNVSAQTISHPLASPTTTKTSWVPSFGKMAKAVVHTGKSISIPFVDRKKRDSAGAATTLIPAIATPLVGAAPSPPPAQSPAPQLALPAFATSAPAGPPAVFSIPPRIPQPTREELQGLSEDEAYKRRREWAQAERDRIVECARLCSQWPQSGYNQAKFGPNGEHHRALYLIESAKANNRRTRVLRTAIIRECPIRHASHGQATRT